jgi:hypothetical protein
VTVPGANVNAIQTNYKWHGIWLKDQATPVVSLASRTYTAAPLITDRGDSGLPTAWVRVAQAFPPNLTNQAYHLGERTCYDPPSRGAFLPNPVSGHGPCAYPRQTVIWAYDSNEFAAVRAGTKQYYDVLPHAVIPITFPIQFPTTPGLGRIFVGGAAVDQTRKLVFLAQQLAGPDQAVAITVWKVN